MALVSILRMMLFALVFVLTLSFFGISIQSIVHSSVGEENIAYLSGLLSRAWAFVLHLYDWATIWIRPTA